MKKRFIVRLNESASGTEKKERRYPLYFVGTDQVLRAASPARSRRIVPDFHAAEKFLTPAEYAKFRRDNEKGSVLYSKELWKELTGTAKEWTAFDAMSKLIADGPESNLIDIHAEHKGGFWGKPESITFNVHLGGPVGKYENYLGKTFNLEYEELADFYKKLTRKKCPAPLGIISEMSIGSDVYMKDTGDAWRRELGNFRHYIDVYNSPQSHTRSDSFEKIKDEDVDKFVARMEKAKKAADGKRILTFDALKKLLLKLGARESEIERLGNMYSVDLFGKRGVYDEHGEKRYFRDNGDKRLVRAGRELSVLPIKKITRIECETFEDMENLEQSRRYETECYGQFGYSVVIHATMKDGTTKQISI